MKNTKTPTTKPAAAVTIESVTKQLKISKQVALKITQYRLEKAKEIEMMTRLPKLELVALQILKGLLLKTKEESRGITGRELTSAIRLLERATIV